MTQIQILNDWIQDAVLVGFFASLLFPFVGLYFPWWRHQFGWNLIAFDGAITIALFPAFLHRVFGVPLIGLGYMYTVAVALTAIPVIVAWRAIVLYQAQRAGAMRERRTRIDQEEKELDKD